MSPGEIAKAALRDRSLVLIISLQRRRFPCCTILLSDPDCGSALPRLIKRLRRLSAGTDARIASALSASLGPDRVRPKVLFSLISADACPGVFCAGRARCFVLHPGIRSTCLWYSCLLLYVDGAFDLRTIVAAKLRTRSADDLTHTSNCRFSERSVHRLEDSARSAKALQCLRNSAIDPDHVDDCPYFFPGNTIVDCATAMRLPFLHLSKGTNDGKVHH